jgi:hypothetical protein
MRSILFSKKKFNLKFCARVHLAVRTGRIVGIVERRWRPYCGSLEETDKQTGNVLFLSVNRKIPKVTAMMI